MHDAPFEDTLHEGNEFRVESAHKTTKQRMMLACGGSAAAAAQGDARTDLFRWLQDFPAIYVLE